MHNGPMSSALTLQSGALRCELAPALGGSVAGLWHGAQPVLRSSSAGALESAAAAGSYPLLPYSNRVGYRRMHWAGRDYLLEPNFAPEPHSIHGVGWQRAWTVASAHTTQAVLHYTHQPDAAWPFAFDSSQTIGLREHTLEMQLAITNRASEPVPVGLGWHPYFAKSAHTHIRFAAQARWDMGDDKLPTDRRPHAGLAGDCHSLDVDHCFDGWNGSLELSESGLRIQVTSDLDCLVVFTTPERDCIAIEPVSHVNNALALAQSRGHRVPSLGLRVLQPGESFSASMHIRVEAAP